VLLRLIWSCRYIGVTRRILWVRPLPSLSDSWAAPGGGRAPCEASEFLNDSFHSSTPPHTVSHCCSPSPSCSPRHHHSAFSLQLHTSLLSKCNTFSSIFFGRKLNDFYIKKKKEASDALVGRRRGKTELNQFNSNVFLLLWWRQTVRNCIHTHTHTHTKTHPRKISFLHLINAWNQIKHSNCNLQVT